MAKERDANLEQMVINFFPEARTSYGIVLQLRRYLPIASFEALEKAVNEIEIEGQKLPINAFRGYIRGDLFPVESVDDLVEKVCRGVEHGLKVVRSPTFPIRRREVEAILTSTMPERPKGARIGGLRS